MRILVVEDEHKIANAIRQGLEQQSYAVDIAYDGDDGLAMATNTSYDLIILDMHKIRIASGFGRWHRYLKGYASSQKSYAGINPNRQRQSIGSSPRP